MKEKKLSNMKVPVIIPVVLVLVIVGLIIALALKGNNMYFFTNESSRYESALGIISYEKPSYVCNEGESFETTIETSQTREPATVKSYSSSDSEVAFVDDNVAAQVKCINCRRVRVVCKKAGNIVLKAESSTGATTSSELVVKQKEGSIAYAKNSYTCNAGETFNTMIKTTNGLYIKSYGSSDKTIATVDDKTGLQVNCVDCKMVRVSCLKAGTVSLTATASNGATTVSSLTVEKNVGTISFAKNSYTCNAGDVIETMITASGGTTPATIASYYSNNPAVATIDDKTSVQTNCVNCRMVRIVCQKKGSTTLTATSSSGAVTTVSVSVSEDIGTIKYEKTSYTCNAGQTFETLITATGTKAVVKSYASSDTTIATVDDKTSLVTNCMNCKMVRVVCKKKGAVTLSATSSTGAKTTSSLTVTEDIGTIKFDQNSFTCNAGETFETMVTATTTSGTATIKSYSSSNTNIATIDDKATSQPKCINCRNLRVTCIKAGTVTLSATSSTGARTAASLTVKENIGTIKFEKTSYTCNAGQTFETMITATGGSTPAGIKSYSSSNTNVATIDDNTSVQVNCYNCRIVRVVCKKAGSVILSATSTTGATTTSSLTVNKDVGTISFAQSSYTCKAGESFQTLITAIGPEGQIATVSTFKSSNTNIATIDTNVTMVPNCYN